MGKISRLPKRMRWTTSRDGSRHLWLGGVLVLAVFRPPSGRWRANWGGDFGFYRWLRAKSVEAACAEGYRVWREHATLERQRLDLLLAAEVPLEPHARRKVVRS